MFRLSTIKGELNPKIYLSVFDSLASFLKSDFSFFDIQITHMTRSIRAMTYPAEIFIYLCYYKTKSLENVHVWCRGEKHTHMITSIKYIHHLCNLHIKEIELLSQKRRKAIKN